MRAPICQASVNVHGCKVVRVKHNTPNEEEEYPAYMTTLEILSENRFTGDKTTTEVTLFCVDKTAFLNLKANILSTEIEDEIQF